MDLETSLEKTQFPLEKQLDLEEVKDMVEGISSFFKCRISYETGFAGEFNPKQGYLEVDERPLKFSGMMEGDPKEGLIMLPFFVETKYCVEKEETLFSSFNFNLTPGYSLEDLQPKEREMISEVGKYISKWKKD